jgi:hypothetical protein
MPMLGVPTETPIRSPARSADQSELEEENSLMAFSIASRVSPVAF